MKKIIFFYLFVFVNQVAAQTIDKELPVKPEQGKAIVYVIRPSFFPQYGVEIYLDSKEKSAEVGLVKGKRYIFFNIQPGKHTVYANAMNWAESSFEAKADDVIFIMQDVSGIGPLTTTELIKIDNQDGIKKLKDLTIGSINFKNIQELNSSYAKNPSDTKIPLQAVANSEPKVELNSQIKTENIVSIPTTPSSQSQTSTESQNASSSTSQIVEKPKMSAPALKDSDNEKLRSKKLNTDNQQPETTTNVKPKQDSAPIERLSVARWNEIDNYTHIPNKPCKDNIEDKTKCISTIDAKEACEKASGYTNSFLDRLYLYEDGEYRNVLMSGTITVGMKWSLSRCLITVNAKYQANGTIKTDRRVHHVEVFIKNKGNILAYRPSFERYTD